MSTSSMLRDLQHSYSNFVFSKNGTQFQWVKRTITPPSPLCVSVKKLSELKYNFEPRTLTIQTHDQTIFY